MTTKHTLKRRSYYWSGSGSDLAEIINVMIECGARKKDEYVASFTEHNRQAVHRAQSSLDNEKESDRMAKYYSERLDEENASLQRKVEEAEAAWLFTGRVETKRGSTDYESVTPEGFATEVARSKYSSFSAQVPGTAFSSDHQLRLSATRNGALHLEVRSSDDAWCGLAAQEVGRQMTRNRPWYGFVKHFWFVTAIFYALYLILVNPRIIEIGSGASSIADSLAVGVVGGISTLILSTLTYFALQQFIPDVEVYDRPRKSRWRWAYAFLAVPALTIVLNIVSGQLEKLF